MLPWQETLLQLPAAALDGVGLAVQVPVTGLPEKVPPNTMSRSPFTCSGEGRPAVSTMAPLVTGSVLPDPVAIPEDPEVARLDAAGKPLVGIAEGSRLLESVRALLQQSGMIPEH